MVLDKIGIIIEGVFKVIDVVIVLDYSYNDVFFLVVSFEFGFEYLFVMVIVEFVKE